MYTNIGFDILLLSINFFSLLGSIIIWRKFRNHVSGTSYWTLGFSCYFISSLFLAICHLLPIGIKLNVSNSLEIMGAYLMFLGYISFYNRMNRIRMTVVFLLMFLLNSIAVYFQLIGEREACSLMVHINNLIPVSLLLLVLLKKRNDNSSRNMFQLIIFGFFAMLILVNIADITHMLVINGSSFILDMFGMINSFLGIITIALLLFSQNQLAHALLQNQLENNIVQLQSYKNELLFNYNELQRTNNDIIGIVAESLELRLSETSNHVKRVSEFTRVILTKLNYHGEDTENIISAAALHDIGKIGISDSILSSEGKFNDNEMEAMKNHTVMGYDILSASKTSLLQLAALIALEHHENWDGSGYPSGKKNDEICLPSRVVSIADTFDALVNSRSYKKAWSFEEAMKYILENSGKRFDPKIVEIIPDCLKEFKVILEFRKPIRPVPLVSV
jgi:HD-GYP domain-containing protein (c-di-GMP phosphodiesterase class II)